VDKSGGKMTNKLLSVSMCLAILYMYVTNYLYPDDALFLVASPNLLFNAFLTTISIIGICLSFRTKLTRSWSYVLVALTALGLSLVGAAGFIYSIFTNNFRVLMPLDYLILSGLGIVYMIFTLTCQHQPLKVRFPSFSFGIIRWIKSKDPATGWQHRPQPT
jgi:hypothetical protein